MDKNEIRVILADDHPVVRTGIRTLLQQADDIVVVAETGNGNEVFKLVEQLAPDVLLVPMLAFDRRGYRLGYGGGFYDRTLAELRKLKPVTVIGVAYAEQEIDEVPVAGYDEPLDWILTERGVIEPKR